MGNINIINWHETTIFPNDLIPATRPMSHAHTFSSCIYTVMYNRKRTIFNDNLSHCYLNYSNPHTLCLLYSALNINWEMIKKQQHNNNNNVAEKIGRYRFFHNFHFSFSERKFARKKGCRRAYRKYFIISMTQGNIGKKHRMEKNIQSL